MAIPIEVKRRFRLKAAVCDRVMVLNYGQKLAEGNPHEIQNDQSVIEAYLGKAGSQKKGSRTVA